MKSSFFCAIPRLYIALYEEVQTRRMAQHSLQDKYIIVPVVSSLRDDHGVAIQTEYFVPNSLVDIYKFDETANLFARRNADHKLVFSAGCNVNGQTNAIFLIGCHMIMLRGLNPEQTFEIFKIFKEFFVYYHQSQVNVLDCWRALHQSKCVGWIDFQEHFDCYCDESLTINIGEFIHYSRFVSMLSKIKFRSSRM